MSAHVLLRVGEHRLALGASEVREFDRSDEGVVLLPAAEPSHVEASQRADWVVALVDGQRWRVTSRPTLVQLSSVNPLPPMLARWANRSGVRGWASTNDGLVLVVTTRFAEGSRS